MSPRRDVFLVADDSDEDRAFITDALRRADRDLDIREVRDGVELLEYLRAPSAKQPYPAFVLLDLQMPRKDGFETLAEIRGNPAFRHSPVIAMFTTATDPKFVQRAYELGANAFIGKPSSVARMRELMALVVHHWFDAAILPEQPAWTSRR